MSPKAIPVCRSRPEMVIYGSAPDFEALADLCSQQQVMIHGDPRALR